MGNILKQDGWGQIPFHFVKLLEPSFNMNLYYPTTSPWHKPEQIHIPKINNVNQIGDILIYTTSMCSKVNMLKVPRAKINIAYSMIESTKVPDSCVNILNNNFDMVIVPDEYYCNIYTNSGVKVPVFTLPLVLDLDNFLVQPLKNKKNRPFVFGSSATFIDRKNHKKTVKAFIKAFKNNKDVHLVIQGRHADKKVLVELRNIIKSKKAKNITIVNHAVSDTNFLGFMKSLDCYVLLSKGEGYSISPRQALSLGLPCILSNNTAHESICRNNFIIPINPKKQESAPKNHFKEDMGYQYDCRTDDVSNAMLEIYNNYNKYLRLSVNAREWSKLYTYNYLVDFYVSCINPKVIKFDAYNKITKDGLVTNSIDLYNKFLSMHS